MITDSTLTKLRAQAELNALHDNAKPEWRELVEALDELEKRRDKERRMRPIVRAHGPDCQCEFCRKIPFVPNEQLE